VHCHRNFPKQRSAPPIPFCVDRGDGKAVDPADCHHCQEVEARAKMWTEIEREDSND
jgi:hypothetical protein